MPPIGSTGSEFIDRALYGSSYSEAAAHWSQEEQAASTAAQLSEPAAGSLDWLKNMAKDNPYYAEKLFDYLTNQQNASDARSYDEYVRKHEKQWLMEDLKAAGLNPYLALNSLGGNAGSSIQASGNTYGASSAHATATNNQNKLIAIMLAAVLGSGSKLLSALLPTILS